MQANAVLWVEGPSDRIYVRTWLRLQARHLVEGVHYSFVLYGGRLAEHLTVGEHPEGELDEPLVAAFIDILRINRHAVFIADSDLTDAGAPLQPYKERLRREIEQNGDGILWITAGTMIENYLEPDVFLKSYSEVHPRSRPNYQGSLYSHPFVGGAKQPNKVAIATAAAALTKRVPDRGDLASRVQDVVRYLESRNEVAAAVAAALPGG